MGDAHKDYYESEREMVRISEDMDKNPKCLRDFELCILQEVLLGMSQSNLLKDGDKEQYLFVSKNNDYVRFIKLNKSGVHLKVLVDTLNADGWRNKYEVRPELFYDIKSKTINTEKIKKLFSESFIKGTNFIGRCN